MNQNWITIRRELHRIPELGFQEYKTQQYLKGVLATFPQEQLQIKEWRTGLLVRITGTNPKKTIGYRADIDGLPMSEETGVAFASEHEGRMHACGHDFHMTIALGLIQRLVEHPVEDDVVVIFQPAEEGPGGAAPLLQSDVWQQWKADVVFALHVAPSLPVGTVETKSGMLFAHTSELFIDFIGKSGHAAFPHLANDMVVALSHFVTSLQSIVSRNVNPLDAAVVTVGKITGGTVQNVIAGRGRLEGTIRTLSEESMSLVKERIEQLARGFQESFQCEAVIDYGSGYYGVNNDEQWTTKFMDIVETKTPYTAKECSVAMTGEDFGYFLKDVPGLMFWLGVDSPYGLHHEKFNPQEEALQVGMDIAESFIRNI